ncbi:MAG TPA: hypothetical protein VFT72_08530 [Opitutaceae bacterium]|nr:hypothetical protein [Opitutaceae bacterium]
MPLTKIRTSWRPRALRRIWTLGGLSLLTTTVSHAAGLIDRFTDDMAGMTEFFETILPGTLKQHNMVLDFTPKAGDLLNQEFIRYPLQIRYGYSEQLELFTGFTPFSPNPFLHGKDHRWGLGEYRFGARYETKSGFWIFDQATVGLENRVPLGNAPVDVIDGYTHVRPYFTATRQLDIPDTKFFMTLSYDRSFNTPSRDRPTDPDAPREHIAEFAPGILYKPGIYGYFFEYDFQHIDEVGGYRLLHGQKLGVIWDVPRERSRRWHLPGKWQIELAGRVIEEESRGTSVGIVTHVRVRTSLREVLGPHAPRGRTP